MDPSFLLSLFFGFATIGGGTFAWTHRRHSELDQRLDTVEMTLHKEFVRKDELMPMMDQIGRDSCKTLLANRGLVAPLVF